MGMPVSIPARDGKCVLLRPSTADFSVFDEVFVRGDYDQDFGAPLTIIDAGAHIGLTSVFFTLKYPQARIVAVEPEDANFALLQRHAALYPNIMPVHAGLWSRETRLKVSNPGAPTWSFRVEESADGFPAVTIDGLMKRFGFEHVDLVKIDIEGSEVEVMDHCDSWLGKVHALALETHDRFGPRSTESVEAAIRRTGGHWQRFASGMNSFFVRD
jgi:FkbM family methyltransferase